MKFISFRSVEIFSDGTLHFSHKRKKFLWQVYFYEKDIKNFSFFKKPTKVQSFQNLSRNFYKLKYKF